MRENMSWSVFTAVEGAILEMVNHNGTCSWTELQDAKVCICQSYSDLGLATPSATGLSFNQFNFRWAYTHLYVTAHIHMVTDILQRFWTSIGSFRTWCNQLPGQTVRVCCVGGGPGSDLIGFVMFLHRCQLNISTMQGDVLDQWTEWKETFHNLLYQLNSQSLMLPYAGTGINYWEFHFDDMLQSQSSVYFQRLRQADLVMMVKFVSAVSADRVGCETRLITILKLMKSGALLFFLDNAGGGYADIICRAANAAGLNQIGKIEHFDSEFPTEERNSMDSSRLPLTKINTLKTRKISAFLWQKEPSVNRPQFRNSNLNNNITAKSKITGESAYAQPSPNHGTAILQSRIPQLNTRPQSTTLIRPNPTNQNLAYPRQSPISQPARQQQSTRPFMTHPNPIQTSRPPLPTIYHISAPHERYPPDSRIQQSIGHHNPTPAALVRPLPASTSGQSSVRARSRQPAKTPREEEPVGCFSALLSCCCRR